MRRAAKLLLCCILAVQGVLCGAQGFDDLKKAKPVQLNSKLQALVDKNDAKGLERLLKSKPETKDEGSRMGHNEKGSPNVVPLFNDVIDRTLKGQVSTDLCRVAFNAGCDVYSVYNGKTPVYQLMDYFATTPSAEAGTGMEVLDMMFAREEFDINRRYRSFPPPFSYLLSSNFKHLDGHYSKDYLSTELLQKIIGKGASLNTYDENGASLLLLANSTGNEYLQGYLIDHGVNINKSADESGNNAVFAAIESSNVDQLRKIVANYGVKLTTADVKDRTSGVSAAMYDYLASECASHAGSYDEYKAFREHFKDKADLVRDGYEKIARSEIAAASTYEQIKLCEERFPDLSSLTYPRKMAIAEKELASVGTIAEIKVFESHYPQLKQKVASRKSALYSRDCKDLQLAYDTAKSTVNSRVKPSYSIDTDAFVKGYENYYDPDNMIPLAKAMKRFYFVLDAVSDKYGPYYSARNDATRRYRDDESRLNEAIGYCSQNEKYGLSSEWMVSDLKEYKNTLLEHCKSCEEAIRMVDKIGIGNVPKPSYKYSSDKNYYYTFKEQTGEFSFEITDYSDGEGYVFYVVHAMKGGKLPGFIDGYSTFEQALVAGYAAGVLGFRRTVGRAYRGGLLTAFIDNQRHKINIETARQTDEAIKVISTWFE